MITMAVVGKAQVQNEKTLHRKKFSRSNSVGPALFERCLTKAIAMCECDIMQPGLAPTPAPQAGFKPKLSDTDLQRSDTLLPGVTRSLCLWKDEDCGLGEYHLTALSISKEEIFLDLPLSGLLQGELVYNQTTELWHEITVCGDRGRPQRLVFNFKSSSETKNFNNCLTQAIDEITGRGTKTAAGLLQDNELGSCVLVQAGQASKAPLITSMASMASTPHPTPRPQGAEAPSLAAVDFPSGLPGARPQEKLPSRVAEQVSEELSAAIQAGNVSKAQQLATCLAVGRTRLNISFDIDSHDDKSKEQEISVTVHVEDRESAGLTLTDVKVRPSDTILDLKRIFFGKYGFPPEVQKWIIGSRICKDEETLSRCDVHTSGHTLYLYLLSARAANITREDYRRQWQGNTPGGRQRAASRPRSGDYESMRMPMMSPAAPGPPSGGQGQGGVPPLGQGQGPPPGSAARQQSQLSAASSASSLAAPSLGLSDMRGPPEPGSGQNSSEPASANRASDVRQVQGQPESAVTGAARELMATGGGEGGVDRNVLQGTPKGPPRPPRPLLQAQQAQQDPSLGWQCVTCTLINQPTRPGCEACGSPRPPDYEVPSGYVVSEEERLRLAREQQLEALMQQEEFHRREQNYQQLLQAENEDLVTNIENFNCAICLDDVPPGDGVVLRECLHMFCKSCLMEAIRLTEEAELKCPYQDEHYSCNASLQEREIRALASDQVYERYLRRSLDVAESQARNSYHCKTADCRGWCIYEDLVNFFRCPVCRHENCLTCRAIHEGMNCKQYQEDLKIRAANDQAAKQTQVVLQNMLEKGEAMHCPSCEVVVQKKDGCDWIRCSICKTEICWVTKGPRWGPAGEGDTSGGCKCRVGGRRCHPKCTNCH